MVKKDVTTLYAVEPEVSGGWGDGTIVTNQDAIRNGTEIIPHVEHLNYRFDGWMGDSIVAFMSTFIITTRLAKAIQSDALTGVRIENVTISTSDMWEQYCASVSLPKFSRLIPTGQVEIEERRIANYSHHDFCWGLILDWKQPASPLEILAPDYLPQYFLAVSGRALEVLKSFQLDNCKIVEL